MPPPVPDTPVGSPPLAWSTAWPLAVGFGVLSLPTLYRLATGIWLSEAQSHGFLVFGVLAWLAWSQRAAFQAPPRPSAMPGWASLIVGLALYAVGRSQDILIFEVGAFIPIVAGVLLACLGTAALRRFAVFLAFMLFLLPVPGAVTDSLTAPLKQLVSSLAVGVLYSVGYPIAQSGVILHLGPYQLLVADACSGLNSIYSLAAVGLIYIYLIGHRNPVRLGLLLAALVPIAILANTLRVVTLALLTFHFGDQAAQGYLHDFAGVSLYLFALALLLGLDQALGLLPWRRGARHHAAAHPAAPGRTRRHAMKPNRQRLRSLLMGAAMCAAAALAVALTPTRQVDADAAPQLETLVPTQFGAWVLAPAQTVQMVDPQQQATLDRIYGDVLMRTYVNTQGTRIMLAIAYGRAQSDDLAVHRPEVCYPAQGAVVLSTQDVQLALPWGTLPARRLVTEFGPRHEPVTYWVMVGERAILRSLPAKLEQLRYGLRGQIPDGFLVRASSIDPNDERAFADQARFLTDLLAALPAPARQRLSGLN